MEGSLDFLFQRPTTELRIFQNLSYLLKPRPVYDRIRKFETTKAEQDNYELQDHARTRCVLYIGPQAKKLAKAEIRAGKQKAAGSQAGKEMASGSRAAKKNIKRAKDEESQIVKKKI